MAFILGLIAISVPPVFIGAVVIGFFYLMGLIPQSVFPSENKTAPRFK